MGTSENNRRIIKEVRNERVQLSEAEAAAFRRVRERSFARMDKEAALLRRARPAENIRGWQKATGEFIAEAFPGFENRRRQILETFTPGLTRTRPDILELHRLDLDLDFDGPSEAYPVFPGPNPAVPPPRPAEGACELWWAGTTMFSDFPEITVDLQGNFVNIFGHVHYEKDELLSGSVGYIEEYVLSPDRFPMLAATFRDPITPTADFEIATDLRISGILSGFTGCYHWLWCADDKWCKCSQITKQTALLSTQQILASRTLPLPMIALVNEHPVGQANPVLTGSFLEQLRFSANLGALFKDDISFLVHIETRYDIQLEGDADIWFRRIGGSGQESVPSAQNAARFQSQPMCLRPRS